MGLAFNPERRGEVLVAAGDRPPAIGVHVHRSEDGGNSWQDITEVAFAGNAQVGPLSWKLAAAPL